MIKRLEEALAKIRCSRSPVMPVRLKIPSSAMPYKLSPDERTIVRKALDRAKRGGYAVEADVYATLHRPWN